VNKLIKLTIIFIALSVFSCKQNKNTSFNNSPVVITDDEINYVNKEAVRKERIQIDDFIRRYEWKMITTETGVSYWIYEKGNGAKTEKGNIVVLDYTITFLNGDTVYTSNIDGNKEFQLGKSNEVSGLEEALLVMHQGDKAKVIVPSFRAYGITGDFNKIAMRNTLVYDIYITKIY
jgi:FKBP-type peptidyl-prolyl cis-trans isomerase